ncbi:MAG: hypothetical protein WB780_11365, partial [Candidatus Acidiferrales bacterium]
MTLLELRHWIRLSSATLLILISALGQSHSQSSENPDLQQLKDKLQHLDEQMQELKEQIQSAEKQAQQRPSTPTNPATVSKPAHNQPQTVPLEGEVTEKKNSVDVYGFVMLDSGYDFKQENPNWFDVMRPT